MARARRLETYEVLAAAYRALGREADARRIEQLRQQIEAQERNETQGQIEA